MWTRVLSTRNIFDLIVFMSKKVVRAHYFTGEENLVYKYAGETLSQLFHVC